MLDFFDFTDVHLFKQKDHTAHSCMNRFMPDTVCRVVFLLYIDKVDKI